MEWARGSASRKVPSIRPYRNNCGCFLTSAPVTFSPVLACSITVSTASGGVDGAASRLERRDAAIQIQQFVVFADGFRDLHKPERGFGCPPEFTL